MSSSSSSFPLLAKMTTPDLSAKRILVMNDSTCLDTSLTIHSWSEAGRRPRYPVEIPVTLSERAQSQWDNYYSAYAELEAARHKFEVATRLFRSEATEFRSMLTPQPTRLAEDIVFPREDIAAMYDLLGARGLKIASRNIRVTGYNCGHVTFYLQQSQVQAPIHYKDYICIVDGNISIRFEKQGARCPPYIEEDLADIHSS